MNTSHHRPADTWSPLYFLASLGPGGLAVTFFMFLMFWVPHPGQPVPVFEHIMSAFTSGGLPLKAAILLAVTGIAGFVFLNIKMLIWNLTRFSQFRKTESYTKLVNSNGETQLLAMPLALAMTVNAGFIVGLVFVPGLWGVVEYLFPLAMIAFALVAYLAFRQIGNFLGRVLSDGGIFDVSANNSFAQLLPAFALSMTAVGMAAPAAMSTVPLTVGVSMILSIMLGTVAGLYALVAAITAFNSMLHHGTAKESAPTLMIVVPILTVIGIMTMRQEHGLHTTFAAHSGVADNLLLTTTILAIQIVFLALGLLVLRRQKYADAYLRGNGNSAGAYALVCPGVALSVMLQFWINKGLVSAGLIAKFGIAYWSFTSLAIASQVAMIVLVFFLNHRHFAGRARMQSVPAE
ncbi:TsoY family (seleno)protein [Pseudosulfitobacter pseudonitzschiae]|uniref:TsoY family (seleno)protein n=1 Tax=Pseudosulfitobacter pseudonitzschiae TaxID=1402135 RepID=UPI003B821E9E